MSTALYLNGTIYTMNPNQPIAQAIAIELTTGRILAVGSNDEIRRVGGQHTELIDLHGKMMLPGFIDAHIHLLGTAYRAQRIDAATCTSEAQVVELVRARAATTLPGQWIQGSHWDRNLWPGAPFPTRASLDAATPNHPVALSSKDGHLLWVNSLALQLAGIDANTPEPATGAILRDGAGTPTGVLQEAAATTLVFDVVTPPDPSTSCILLEHAITELQRSGITSIHDIEDELALNTFQQLRAEGKLGVRVEMLMPRRMLAQLPVFAMQNAENDFLRVGGIKIFADGTLGSQTAAMLQSFEGTPDNYGILAIPEAEMNETIDVATQMGLIIATHVIGDRAAQITLNAIEQAQQHHSPTSSSGKRQQLLRYRLEHVQLITPEDLVRMRRLNVIASIQPYHAVADRDIAERYWGERHRHAYAYRTIHELGIPLAMGSDAPVETFDPLRILYAATVRSDPTSNPSPWLPEQALSISDALYAYTQGAAYAGAEEHHKGSLTPGKLGDAVVLHENPFNHPPQALADNSIHATILGGKIVHGT